MNKSILRLFAISACVLAFTATASAQSRVRNSRNADVAERKRTTSAPMAVLKGTGKVAVVIVGTSAKVAWGVTKFTAQHVVGPVVMMVARPILFHALPAVGKFALKNGLRYGVPFGARLLLL